MKNLSYALEGNERCLQKAVHSTIRNMAGGRFRSYPVVEADEHEVVLLGGIVEMQGNYYGVPMRTKDK